MKMSAACEPQFLRHCSAGREGSNSRQLEGNQSPSVPPHPFDALPTVD